MGATRQSLQVVLTEICQPDHQTYRQSGRPLVACRTEVYGALVSSSRFVPENVLENQCPK